MATAQESVAAGPSTTPPPLEARAVLALALAAASYVALPVVGAVAALAIAPGSKERMHRPGRETRGASLATAAQVLAGVELALVAVAVVVFGGRRFLASQFVDTFFNGGEIRSGFRPVAESFWLNIRLFLVAEALVLVWGLLVALVRMSDNPVLRPLRWAAIAYIDVFRALPGLVVVFFIGFGMPLAGVPFFSTLSLFWLACIALTLVYGAYVAEVYRAGIESIHWSQAAASRSLGLSHLKTLRFVVLPQAVRRVVPPLLNDFIGLQKDTVFVATIGLVEAFRRAQLVAGKHFNPTAVTVVGILYLIITVPMTRLTDYLVRRDAARMRADG